jgi:ceramide glucosyltransferase
MFIAASYLVAYLILRVGLTWLTGAWGIGDRELVKILWLVPVRDAIGFIVWVSGFFTDRITWRGLEYRVKKGRLIPVPTMRHTPAPRRESISSVVS